jgi:hypothetical protein
MKVINLTPEVEQAIRSSIKNLESLLRICDSNRKVKGYDYEHYKNKINKEKEALYKSLELTI